MLIDEELEAIWESEEVKEVTNCGNKGYNQNTEGSKTMNKYRIDIYKSAWDVALFKRFYKHFENENQAKLYAIEQYPEMFPEVMLVETFGSDAR